MKSCFSSLFSFQVPSTQINCMSSWVRCTIILSDEKPHLVTCSCLFPQLSVDYFREFIGFDQFTNITPSKSLYFCVFFIKLLIHLRSSPSFSVNNLEVCLERVSLTSRLGVTWYSLERASKSFYSARIFQKRLGTEFKNLMDKLRSKLEQASFTLVKTSHFSLIGKFWDYYNGLMFYRISKYGYSKPTLTQSCLCRSKFSLK